MSAIVRVRKEGIDVLGRVLRCVLVAAAVTIAAAPPVAGWDCYGGWNPNQTCTSQASSFGSCWGCCNIIFDCNIFRGKDRLHALSEFDACSGHCMTDKF